MQMQMQMKKLKSKLSCFFCTYTHFTLFSICVLLIELILGIIIIEKVSYTEIDWQAYMSQISMILHGERDYIAIRGGTGPLVYPAGFVYIYAFLYTLTEKGTNIHTAQYLFLSLYLLQWTLLLKITSIVQRIPPWTLLLLMSSKRMHSIYMLRCFNDPIAIFFLYLSLLAFLSNRWYVGSWLFSCGVSIKMNILLFAPGVLLCMLLSSGLFRTLQYLSICAGWQLILGAPFLYAHYTNYLLKAFEFNRVFTYIWSVNWKFIPNVMFISKPWALLLLAGHLVTLGTSVFFFYKSFKVPITWSSQGTALPAQYLTHILFLTNFIGIVFARTLHVQFYSWYFHSLPYLLWSVPISNGTRILLFYGIELSFNVFPSTWLSSLILQSCHVFLMGAHMHHLFSIYKKRNKAEKTE